MSSPPWALRGELSGIIRPAFFTPVQSAQQLVSKVCATVIASVLFLIMLIPREHKAGEGYLRKLVPGGYGSLLQSLVMT